MFEKKFNRRNLTIILGLIILVLVLFYPIVFSGKTFGSPDSLNPRGASIILQEMNKLDNEFPLWQPWIFSGMPTADAFTFISSLYFPNYILNLFFLSSNLTQLLHLLFAGIGSYLLLRFIGLSCLSAFLGGSAFMITPFMITMIVFGHGSQMMTTAYIPWIMMFTMKLLRNPNLKNIGILAILMGFQLQRAHVQIAYYTWMLIGVYVLITFILNIKDKKSKDKPLISLGAFTFSAILAIAIALVIYLPSLEYTPFSVRGSSGGGADYNYATSWSFSPKELLTFFIPSALGFGGQTYWGDMPFTDYPNYMGIITLLLAIIGFVYKRDRFMWFLFTTSLLAIFISFGKNLAIIYDLFYNFFPFFNKFRVPAMILILVQFNTCIMAAIGMDHLISINKNKLPNWFWPSTGVLIFLLLILSFGESILKDLVSSGFTQPRTQDPRLVQAINSLRWDMWYKDAWALLFYLSTTMSLIWCFIFNKVSTRTFSMAILLLLVLDVIIVDNKIIQPKKESGRSSQLLNNSIVDRYFQHDQISKILSSDKNELFRVYPAGQLFGETRLRAFGIESIGGYHPAKLNVYNNFLKNTNNASTLALMGMLNVKYFLTTQSINYPGLIEIKQARMKSGRGNIPVSLYRLENYQKRAWFARNIEVYPEIDFPWEKIKSQSYDPQKVAFVSQNDISINTTFSMGEINSINNSLHKLEIETESDSTSFLIVSEVFYPLRWKATIDGEQIEYYKTNGVIRGLIIPKGRHKIVFNYDRSSFNKGVLISLSSFFITIGMIIFGYRKSRY
ncbi:MAG: hypothetical protein VX260_06825 [Candidatus Neomarinimicrobiota bacterium]|nr:hypothetical protein [Candidatus Neomarinimicrobiota bacterium]